jgi:hypothetical protein
MGFEVENCCNRYPWPGNPWIQQTTYTQSGAGGSDEIGLQLLAPDSGQKYLPTTDCDGNDASARVGLHQEFDADYDMYTIAFPQVGVTKPCGL